MERGVGDLKVMSDEQNIPEERRTPIVAIVGLPNVGKSTLFNRIVGRQLAIVDDTPGVTRDRNYALVERYSIPFYLVDTAGFDEAGAGSDELHALAQRQTKAAVEEADAIIAVFDAKAGVQPGDHLLLDFLRQAKQPLLYVVNKVDGQEQSELTYAFYELGVDELQDMSALHGRGVRDVVESVLRRVPDYEALRAICERDEADVDMAHDQVSDDIVDELEAFEEEQEEVSEREPEYREDHFVAPMFEPGEEQDEEQYLREFGTRQLSGFDPDEDLEGADKEAQPVVQIVEPELVRVAIIGRPNVGKSTLLNRFIGEDRAITSSVAGTTRDTLHAELVREGKRFQLVDTAGLRRKGRVGDNIEQYSVLRAMRAIGQCDVAVVVLDASSGPTDQDAKVVGIAHEQGKGIVVAVNKWDLVEKDHKTVKEFGDQVREAFKFAPYAPIVYCSAIRGRRVPNLLDAAWEIARERTKRISTNHVNRTVTRALRRVPAPTYRGQTLKCYFVSQIDIAPPRFVAFLNYPDEANFSYRRSIKNALRREYGFEGTDIKLIYRKR